MAFKILATGWVSEEFASSLTSCSGAEGAVLPQVWNVGPAEPNGFLEL